MCRNPGAWLNVRGTLVIGTVLAATKFYYFLCERYDVTPLPLPPTIKENAMAAPHPSPYVTELSAENKAPPLYFIIKCAVNSYTLINKTLPSLHTRRTPHPPGLQQILKKRYTMGVTDWRQVVK